MKTNPEDEVQKVTETLLEAIGSARKVLMEHGLILEVEIKIKEVCKQVISGNHP